jgi:hypothetical protein
MMITQDKSIYSTYAMAVVLWYVYMIDFFW